PAKRSASRGETTPVHHSGTFPAGGALRLFGLPARRQWWTGSPVSAAPPGRKHANPSLRHIPRRRRAAPCPGTGPQTAVDW
ncbi:TPA: hypothetical protein ACW72G_005253, partial [Klebsiella michiganensis]